MIREEAPLVRLFSEQVRCFDLKDLQEPGEGWSLTADIETIDKVFAKSGSTLPIPSYRRLVGNTV
jgi:hypothetical protein